MLRGALLAIMTLCLPLAAEDSKIEGKYRSGGHIRMELGAGDAEIVGTAGDSVVITYTADKPSEVKVNFHVENDVAIIQVSLPHNNFHYKVQVPQHSHLRVRMSAGDLEVSGVKGEKDIELTAGDLTVNVGDPRDYGPVDASVTMGDLNAPAFNQSKGGMWRRIRLQGDGSYRLHAHVMTGDLKLQ